MKPPWERYRWKGERRAGYVWRLLAHKDCGPEDGWWSCRLCGWKGQRHDGHPKKCEGDWDHRYHSSTVELHSTDFSEPVCFDEVVVDDWFHIEKMDDRHWWMRIGDLNVNVHVRSDGTRTLSGWWETEDGKPPYETGF